MEMENKKINQKFHLGFSIIGFFLPVIGIFISNLMLDDERKISVKRASALSTLLVFLGLIGFISYYVGSRL